MGRKNNGAFIDRILANSSCGDDERKIVDIITFCEHPDYLNFNEQDPKLELWPMQKIVLKLFYRGSEGNEQIFLTDDELAILKSIAEEEDLDYDAKFGGFNQVIEKYKRRETEFTHLLLIMGRRSSKTMMVSIIAAYEAYKLCEAPEGNPHKKYNIAADKPIHIINLAVSEGQAFDPLFREIEARVLRSNYFIDKINHEASIMGKMYLLTDADKRENVRRRERGIMNMNPGSIILLSGHSNSKSLRGHATKCVLFDEFAHFPSTETRNAGDDLYKAMTPSMKQFGKHGKVIMLSDPVGREGLFWKIFELAQEQKKNEDGKIEYAHDEYLAIQLPTWRMNPNPELCKEELIRTEKAKDPTAFLSAWNARFVGEQGSRYFNEARLIDCVDPRREEAQRPDPYCTYYIHLDPATSNHNYALCMVHSITYTNPQMDVKRKIFVDYVKYWRPDKNGPVLIRDVEQTIRDLCRRFRVATVTFDAFQSAQTIQNLRAMGINAFETAFRADYINDIYGELRNLVNSNDLVLYPHDMLFGEMKHLLHKIQGRGIKKYFDSDSMYPSDDCVDALAGATFQALHSVVIKQLPRSGVVWTGRR